jgi:hypothetical protein
VWWCGGAGLFTCDKIWMPLAFWLSNLLGANIIWDWAKFWMMGPYFLGISIWDPGIIPYGNLAFPSVTFGDKFLGGSMIARHYDEDSIIQFAGFLFSFKAVHGNLIYRSQDHDNDSFTIVEIIFGMLRKYFWIMLEFI